MIRSLVLTTRSPPVRFATTDRRSLRSLEQSIKGRPGVDMARSEPVASRSERLLMASGVVFAVALLVHGADHARRGVGELQPTVLWLGNAQTVGALAALFLVFTGHRWAPVAAIAIGFASAVGFAVVHLLPDWGLLSDAFHG